MGFKRRTIYNVIKKIEDRKCLLRKKKISKIPSNVINRINSPHDGKLGSSLRKTACKVKTSYSTVRRILVKSKIKKYTRKNIPKLSGKQLGVVKTRLRKLREGMLKPTRKLIPILDDESYFSLEGYNDNGNKYFYSSNV